LSKSIFGKKGLSPNYVVLGDCFVYRVDGEINQRQNAAPTPAATINKVQAALSILQVISRIEPSLVCSVLTHIKRRLPISDIPEPAELHRSIRLPSNAILRAVI